MLRVYVDKPLRKKKYGATALGFAVSLLKVSVRIVTNASKEGFFTYCGFTPSSKSPTGQQFLIINDRDIVTSLLAVPILGYFSEFMALYCEQVKVQDKFTGIERAPDHLLIREQVFIFECIAN